MRKLLFALALLALSASGVSADQQIYIQTQGGITGGPIFGVGTLGTAAFSGDCTSLANSLSLTCTKTNGVSFAASATTDTTNAANISSGTLPAARLPNPSATTLGGVESIAPVGHQWIDSISTLGVPHLSQPTAADISGLGTAATVNTGTSGSLIPLLSTANTWSLAQTFSAPPVLASITGLTQCLHVDATGAISGTGADCGSASGGSGTVTSVGLSLPSIFTVTGSPVTTAGTLTGALATQSANTIFAGPSSGLASAPTFRTLTGADLPAPSASTLGGIESYTAVPHQWINAISTAGAPSSSQPACADLSDAAASCATDATNAANISSGTLPAARLPSPSATTLGGIESAAAVSHQWIDSISTLGVPHLSQPSAADISGLGTAATQNTGTSGATVPLLNGSNTTSGNNVHSGTETFNGTLISAAGIRVKLRVATTTPVTVATTDYFVCTNMATAGAVAVSLPANPTAGDTYLIKDCKGDAATNNVTISPAAGTIDGAATAVINTNYQSIAVTYNGTEWSIN